jgi:hypothetical protein
VQKVKPVLQRTVSSGSVRRWCDLRERSSVDRDVTGIGRDRDGYTPPWFLQQEGQWFSKAVHILSRNRKLLYVSDCPVISDDRMQLFRTQHSWLTCLR